MSMSISCHRVLVISTLALNIFPTTSIRTDRTDFVSMGTSSGMMSGNTTKSTNPSYTPQYPKIEGWEYIKPGDEGYNKEVDSNLPDGWVKVRPMRGDRRARYWNEVTGATIFTTPEHGVTYHSNEALQEENLDSDLLAEGVSPQVWKQFYRLVDTQTKGGYKQQLKEKVWINQESQDSGYVYDKSFIKAHPGRMPNLQRLGGVPVTSRDVNAELRNLFGKRQGRV
mmetsp:Transcript_111469/g.176120  ORF Transcript_111469/g.176120 Transcript_111469/m.176120 type:complete len:225 (-) Transcript_111469:26-700(-)